MVIVWVQMSFIKKETKNRYFSSIKQHLLQYIEPNSVHSIQVKILRIMR